MLKKPTVRGSILIMSRFYQKNKQHKNTIYVFQNKCVCSHLYKNGGGEITGLVYIHANICLKQRKEKNENNSRGNLLGEWGIG